MVILKQQKLKKLDQETKKKIREGKMAEKTRDQMDNEASVFI